MQANTLYYVPDPPRQLCIKMLLIILRDVLY